MSLYRPGVPNGVVGVGKSDGNSQQTGFGMRSSVPRTDADNSSLINDRRDRPIGSDKERVNIRAINKYVHPYFLEFWSLCLLDHIIIAIVSYENYFLLWRLVFHYFQLEEPLV